MSKKLRGFGHRDAERRWSSAGSSEWRRRSVDRVLLCLRRSRPRELEHSRAYLLAFKRSVVVGIFMIEEFIPAGLRSKLIQGPLFGTVDLVARFIEGHFKLSGVPFFREYTDHSFLHCVEVFKTACDLLTDESIDVLSSDDMSILLLACLFHDSGLHITEDVFLALTDHSNKGVAIPDFDSRSWPALWTDFIGEAKRFSAKKLISLFGDNAAIREPPRQPLEMTQRDRLLIGEFLRADTIRDSPMNSQLV